MTNLNQMGACFMQHHEPELSWFTSFNEAEDQALNGLPVEAQLLYLRGFRRYMDPLTDVVGDESHEISLSMLADLLEIFPHQGMKGVRPDKSKVRRLIGWLERAGLIERISDDTHRLVYFLPKASATDLAEGDLTEGDA